MTMPKNRRARAGNAGARQTSPEGSPECIGATSRTLRREDLDAWTAYERGEIPFVLAWRKSYAIPGGILTATQRHILDVLSLHMNADGRSCFPSVPLIAAEAGLGLTAVKSALRAVETAGYVERKTGGASGRGDRSEYRASIPAEISLRPERGHAATPSETSDDAWRRSERGHLATKRGHLATGKGSRRDPEEAMRRPEADSCLTTEDTRAAPDADGVSAADARTLYLVTATRVDDEPMQSWALSLEEAEQMRATWRKRHDVSLVVAEPFVPDSDHSTSEERL
jgi:hypothetical protein